MSLEKNPIENSIVIKVNGIETSLSAECVISDYLLKAEISGRFIVILNEQIVHETAYSTTVLNDGDRFDIISPISGG